MAVFCRASVTSIIGLKIELKTCTLECLQNLDFRLSIQANALPADQKTDLNTFHILSYSNFQMSQKCVQLQRIVQKNCNREFLEHFFHFMVTICSITARTAIGVLKTRNKNCASFLYNFILLHGSEEICTCLHTTKKTGRRRLN